MILIPLNRIGRSGGVAVISLMLLGWSLEAQAATPMEAIDHLRTIFSELTVALNKFATGNAELSALGRRTAVALFGMLLVWGIVRSWVLDQGMVQLLPEFIQPVIMLGLTLWAVDHLGPVVQASVAGLGGVFSQTLGLAGVPDEIDIMQRMAGAGFDVIAAAPTHGEQSMIQAIKTVADDMMGALMRYVSALLLLAAGVIASGVMVLSKVQTTLAVLFAPIMIPWAMWKPTTFLFNAWLSFLIGGAMQGVMASAIAALTVTMVDKVVLLTQSVRADDSASYIIYSVIVLMAALIAFLFLSVGSLTRALVGSAGIDVTGWIASATAATKALAPVTKLLDKLVVRAANQGRHGSGSGGGGSGPGSGSGAGGPSGRGAGQGGVRRGRFARSAQAPASQASGGAGGGLAGARATGRSAPSGPCRERLARVRNTCGGRLPPVAQRSRSRRRMMSVRLARSESRTAAELARPVARRRRAKSMLLASRVCHEELRQRHGMAG
jgi:hypothetical protein